MCDVRPEIGSSEAYGIELFAAVRRIEALIFVRSVGQISLTSKQKWPGFQARLRCTDCCGKCPNVPCQVARHMVSSLRAHTAAGARRARACEAVVRALQCLRGHVHECARLHACQPHAVAGAQPHRCESGLGPTRARQAPSRRVGPPAHQDGSVHSQGVKANCRRGVGVAGGAAPSSSRVQGGSPGGVRGSAPRSENLGF